MRVGIGIDSHRFSDGRKLILGGVEIAHDQGLVGHSDADVLTHAVMDALLGAAGLGDIGQHFPDTDPSYTNADSIALLKEVVALISHHNLRVSNVDTTLMMERPRVAQYRDAIRESLAAALGISSSHVNFKATTGEGMGFVGRCEGVAALAVAMLEPI